MHMLQQRVFSESLVQAMDNVDLCLMVSRGALYSH